MTGPRGDQDQDETDESWQDAAQQGLVPWPPDEFEDFLAVLQQQPAPGTERIQALSHRFHLLLRHYHQDRALAGAHFCRWEEIDSFLRLHRERLLALGLLTVDGAIAGPLLDRLCHTRFLPDDLRPGRRPRCRIPSAIIDDALQQATAQGDLHRAS